jgi:hypothetical protein
VLELALGIPGILAIWAGVSPPRSWRDRRTAYLARFWVPVEGEILESNAERSNLPGLWSPAVRFRYGVGGHIYVGREIHPRKRTRTTRAGARRWCEHHAKGSRVRVYWDPRDPSDACLERTGGETPIEIAGRVAAIGLGITLLLAAR